MWNDCLINDKTFANFKAHIQKEHQALKQVGALTVHASNLYQTNMLQQAVNQQTDLEQNLKTTVDEQVKNSLLHALSQYTQDLVIDDKADEHQVNNATQQSSEVAMLLQLMTELNKKIYNIAPTRTPTKNITINPKTVKPYRRHCYSCGCCDHWGENCINTKNGHKDNATFNNRMAGSNFNCQLCDDRCLVLFSNKFFLS